MEYAPSAQEVQELIEDFAQDFGVTLPFEDAERMLALHEELCLLFEKYSDGEPIHPHLLLE